MYNYHDRGATGGTWCFCGVNNMSTRIFIRNETSRILRFKMFVVFDRHHKWGERYVSMSTLAKNMELAILKDFLDAGQTGLVASINRDVGVTKGVIILQSF